MVKIWPLWEWAVQKGEVAVREQPSLKICAHLWNLLYLKSDLIAKYIDDTNNYDI